MNGTTQFRLVVKREVTESFRRTSVRILIGVLLVAASLGVILPEVIGGGGPPSYDVYVDEAVPEEVTAQLPSIAEAQDAEVTLVVPGDLEADDPRTAVEERELDAAILPGERTTVVVEEDRSDPLVSIVGQAASTPALTARLEAAGLNAEVASTLASTPSIQLVRVDDEDQSERRGVASLASIVLYFALLTVTIQVANGTAIEKASRISEVLLAVVRPGTLLFGKVVGVALVALSGVVALVVPVLVKGALGGSLPAAALPSIGISLVFFVFGLALWAPLAGMFGSMVERQEEVGTAMQPLTIVLIGAFLVATATPDSLLGAVLGYLPVTSPIVEPTRIAYGASSPVEAVVSGLLLVVGAVLAVRVGGGVYRRSIVRTGRRLRLSEVF
ncbi:MAG: ABC transporter permease [Acidimicrobiales bacterium]|nr:ABC transporter permease [Acidimicrobiales bacterium]